MPKTIQPGNVFFGGFGNEMNFCSPVVLKFAEACLAGLSYLLTPQPDLSFSIVPAPGAFCFYRVMNNKQVINKMFNTIIYIIPKILIQVT